VSCVFSRQVLGQRDPSCPDRRTADLNSSVSLDPDVKFQVVLQLVTGKKTAVQLYVANIRSAKRPSAGGDNTFRLSKITLSRKEPEWGYYA
jgi:hypothetical protein